MQESKNSEVIDLRIVFRSLWNRKLLFVKVWIVTFILACAYILPQPRTYVSDITLAPEMGDQSSGGALSSIASSFGFDLGGMQSNDAFYPELYPDLISTNEFLVDLLYVRVRNVDGTIDTTYLNYMLKHQKKNWVKYPLKWCTKKLKNLFEGVSTPVRQDTKLDPLRLSRSEDNLVNKIRQNISCNVDTKTSVITITVKDQDPVICAALADSTRIRLQHFITNYRTSKARIDEEYYRHLADSAQAEYEDIVARYNRYCDTHQNVVLQSYISGRDELENDLQTKLSTLNAMRTQYQAAKAKIQERTPAFTVLKAASVPIKPSAPKRIIFVIAMLFLATLLTSLYLLKEEIKALILLPEDE